MIAKTLRKHEALLLNWFESQGLSSGVIEGVNNKAKLTMRESVRFQGRGNHFHRTVSSAWQLSRAKTNSQILLTRHSLSIWIRGVFSIVAEQTVS